MQREVVTGRYSRGCRVENSEGIFSLVLGRPNDPAPCRRHWILSGSTGSGSCPRHSSNVVMGIPPGDPVFALRVTLTPSSRSVESLCDIRAQCWLVNRGAGARLCGMLAHEGITPGFEDKPLEYGTHTDRKQPSRPCEESQAWLEPKAGTALTGRVLDRWRSRAHPCRFQVRL